MDRKTQIRAWKDPKFRATLEADQVAPHPAGERLVEVDESELAGAWGGFERNPYSQGYVCSYSGECNGTGESCWAF